MCACATSHKTPHACYHHARHDWHVFTMDWPGLAVHVSANIIGMYLLSFASLGLAARPDCGPTSHRALASITAESSFPGGAARCVANVLRQDGWCWWQTDSRSGRCSRRCCPLHSAVGRQSSSGHVNGLDRQPRAVTRRNELWQGEWLQPERVLGSRCCTLQPLRRWQLCPAALGHRSVGVFECVPSNAMADLEQQTAALRSFDCWSSVCGWCDVHVCWGAAIARSLGLLQLCYTLSRRWTL